MTTATLSAPRPSSASTPTGKVEPDRGTPVHLDFIPAHDLIVNHKDLLAAMKGVTLSFGQAFHLKPPGADGVSSITLMKQPLERGEPWREEKNGVLTYLSACAELAHAALQPLSMFLNSGHYRGQMTE